MDECPYCLDQSNYVNDEVFDELRNLPILNISSPVSNVPHLTEADIDLHMPNDINFDYYSTHNFHSDKDIIECSSTAKSFSALHCNVRSLQGNYDCFTQMLSEFNFTLIPFNRSIRNKI